MVRKMSSTNMSPTATGTCICFLVQMYALILIRQNNKAKKKFLVNFLANTWWFQT